MNKKIKNILCAALCLFSLSSDISVFAMYNKTEFLSATMFDNEITNQYPTSVVCEGSLTARIAEDGKRNKAFYVDIPYVSSEINIPFRQVISDDRYIISFDAKFKGEKSTGSISVINNGKAVDILNIDSDGTLRTKDKKIAGNIAKDRYTNIALVINNDYGFYSVMINGRTKVDSWPLSATLNKASGITVSVDSNKIEGSGLYIDDVLCYTGNTYTKDKPAVYYEPQSTEYYPVDESGADQISVLKRVDFDDGSMSGLTFQEKDSHISVDVKDRSGYLSINHTGSEDALVDVNCSGEYNDLVLSADFADFTGGFLADLFYLRDITTAGTTVFSPVVIKDSAITYPGGSYPIKKKTWYNIALCMHFKKGTYDLYINNTKIFADKEIGNDNFKVVALWRVYVMVACAQGERLGVDNVAIYTGTEPADISESDAVEVSVFNANDGKSSLTGMTALSPYSNKLFNRVVKTDVDEPCINTSSESLVSEDTFMRFTGKKVTVSGNNAQVENAKFTIGSKTAVINGKTVELDIAPQMSNGKFMLPIIAYCENTIAPENWLNDGHGLLVTGTGAAKMNDESTKAANRFMFFDRPNGETLKNKFTEHNNGDMTVHPRIMATKEDFERIRNSIKTDDVYSKWWESIKMQADRYVDDSVVLKYGLSSDNVRWNDGRTLQERAPYLAFAYQITGEEKYARRLITHMNELAEMADWNPGHSLDTAAAAYAMAISYDWLYDYMTPEQREYFAQRSQKLALEPGNEIYHNRATYDNQFWIKTDTNWGLIVNGGYASLALATCEYNTDYAFDVMSEALRSMEFALYRMAPDGAWYEGPGYWFFIMQNWTTFLGAFDKSMGYVYGLNYKGLDKFAAYQTQFTGPDYDVNNFHDSDSGYTTHPGITMLASLFNNKGLMKHRLEEMKIQSSAAHPIDMIYADTSVLSGDESIEMPLDSHYGEIEFISMREAYADNDALWVSTHGGISNTAHDHLDVGSYIFSVGGVRWAIDMGKEEWSYVAQSEDPSRIAGVGPYFYYRRKGEGHNMLIFNPDENLEYDINKLAKATKPVGNENGAYAVMDLGEVFSEDVTEYRRGYLLDDGRRSFTVRDEFTLKHQSEMYWFMHTYGDIEIIDNNTALIYDGGRILKMQFITDAKDYKLTAMKAEKLPKSPKFVETENTGVSKVALKFSGEGTMQVTVKMSLLEEAPYQSEIKNVAIDEWNISMLSPASKKSERSSAALKTIELDGSTLIGFGPDTYSYSTNLREDGTLPQIVAVSANGERIEQNTVTPGVGGKLAVVKVYDAAGGYNVYTISFLPYNPASLNNYERHSAIVTEASSEQLEEGAYNYKEGSADGNIGTRWSANGIGEWIIHDLGESKAVDAIGAALWQGGRREFYFEIMISEDGYNWTSLGNFTTSGKSEDIEVFPLDKAVSARYIKYIGGGNSVNEWNNVIELCVLKRK